MDELRFKDLESVNKDLEKLERTVVRGNDKKLKPEFVSILNIPDSNSFLVVTSEYLTLQEYVRVANRQRYFGGLWAFFNSHLTGVHLTVTL